jgi:chromosome partitioning protein
LLELASNKKLYKVVVLNPKGGSGKTTLAFGLAGYLASTGRRVGLLDDRQ